MSNLLPCPFCGSEAQLHGTVAPGQYATCQFCAASTRTCSNPAKAAAAWNTRTESAEVKALRAELAEADAKIAQNVEWFARMTSDQFGLAQDLGQFDLLDDERCQLAQLEVRRLRAVAEAARREVNRDHYDTTAALAALDNPDGEGGGK